MQIKLQDLDVRHLDLDIPSAVGTTSLRFEHLTDGRGMIGIDESVTRLDALAIRELLLSIVALPLGPAATLRTTTPAMIANATMDGRIAEALEGTLRFGLINTEGLSFEAGALRAQSDFRTEEVNLTLDGDAGRAAFGTVRLENGQTNAGGFLTRLGSLTLTGFRGSWAEPLRVEALKAHAQGIDTQRENVSLSIAGIDLADGFVLEGRELRIPQLLVGQATLVVDDLLGEARAAARAEAEEAREGEDAAPPPEDADRLHFDAGILDTINGQLDVDLTLAATVPVLGHRRATHHFRIPIDGGIINYRELERDLADLEDAFIDITLRGSSLVLERDIPLIPGFEKPILIWDLAAGDVDLAKQHLVRLRTLPHFRMPAPESAGKKSKLKLHRLDLDDIVVALSVDDAAVLTSGAGSLRTSLDELSLGGSLHYQPETEHAPTALRLAASGLTAVARDLSFGGAVLAGGELRVGAIEDASLTFDGLKPRRLQVTLRNLSLSDLVLAL